VVKLHIVGYAPVHFSEITMAPLGIPRRPRLLFTSSTVGDSEQVYLRCQISIS